MRKRTWFIVLAVVALVVASLACGESTPQPRATATPVPESQEVESEPSQTTAPTGEAEPTDTPEPTPLPPTPTRQPIGMSRKNPHPSSAVVSAPNWEVQVQQVVRGNEAWQLIQAANQFNEPAPEGMEYLLVRLHVKCTYDDNEEHPISESDFKVTGDRLIRYWTASVVAPDPQLDARLFQGGETEGWAVYLVGQAEGNLILIVDETFSFDEDRLRFIALDEGAAIRAAPELGNIKPTDLGTERQNPAPFGETVTTENWEVTVLEAVRGDRAWAMVQEANQFNDPPEEGMEYVAVKTSVRYISTVDEPETMDSTYFNSTDSANVLYDLPMVVDPSPALDVTLYPGGEYEGWVTLQAAQGGSGLLAVFDPPFTLTGRNRRFLSLEP
jgi:hypothetical protein